MFKEKEAVVSLVEFKEEEDGEETQPMIQINKLE